jgi:hypothetical protein
MDTTYDTPPEDEEEERGKKRRKGSSEGSGIVPRASLLVRRQNSAGLWKGVRWKPVLDDSEVLKKTACSECHRSLNQPLPTLLQRRYTDPTGGSSSSLSKPGDLPPFAFTTDKTQTNSLPNISVSRADSPAP